MGLLDQLQNAKTDLPNKEDMLEDWESDDGSFTNILRLCLYGASGVGKSVLGGEIAQRILPPGKKVLYLDTATGYQSLLNHTDVLDLSLFERKEYKGLSQLNFIAQMMDEKHPAFEKYGVIVLDEHSSMHRINLNRLLQARKPSEQEKMEDINSQPEYLTAQNQLWSATYELMKKSSLSIIFLSHYRDNPDEKKRLMTRPNYPPGFLAGFSELMSAVNRLTADTDSKGEYVREIQNWPTDKVVAKTRIKNLPVYCDLELYVTEVTNWTLQNKDD